MTSSTAEAFASNRKQRLQDVQHGLRPIRVLNAEFLLKISAMDCPRSVVSCELETSVVWPKSACTFIIVSFHMQVIKCLVFCDCRSNVPALTAVKLPQPCNVEAALSRQ